jgi:molybdopterin molybdotransferase
MVGFEAIVLPLLRRWSGVGQAKRRVVKARMARRVPTTPGIRHYLRVRLEETGRCLLASPITITGSGLLSSITRADGIVVIGEDYEGVEEGSEVNVELWRVEQCVATMIAQGRYSTNWPRSRSLIRYSWPTPSMEQSPNR